MQTLADGASLTVKDVNYVSSEWIVSGSDDGRLYMYDKKSSEIKGLWSLDSHVVNVMAPHPTLPLIAVSGIDDTPRILGVKDPSMDPLASDLINADRITDRNLSGRA